MTAVAVAPPGNAPALADFRTVAARHRQSQQYTIPYIAGSTTNTPLLASGYLNDLEINLQLTVIVGTTGTVTDMDQFISGYLPQIGLVSPQGLQWWNTNSRDEWDWNYCYWKNYNPTSDDSYSNTTPSAGSISSGTYTINARIRIPVALNDDNNFDTYLLMRQIGNNQYSLNLKHAAASDIVGAGTAMITSITGSIYVREIYYDALTAAQSNIQPPDFTFFVRKRFQQQQLINGQNDVSYVTGPTITDALFRLINNGVADSTINNMTYLEVKANGGTIIDHRTGQDLRADQTRRSAQKFRNGIYYEDFLNDSSDVNNTRARDFLNSSQATQLDFFVQYAGTPTGNSYVQTSWREIVKLAA